jgi:hypothetical protein
MAYTRTWDAAYEAIPADANNVSEGAAKMRQVKVDARERLAKDHYLDIAGTDADHGEHVKVTLREQAADPGTVANKGFLYTKDAGGVTELYYMDSGGTVTKITASGAVFVATDKILVGDDNVTVSDGLVQLVINGTEQVRLTDGVLAPTTANDVDLGSSAKEFKNLYLEGNITIDDIGQGKDVTAAIHRKILTIGDWNMDSTAAVYIAHGLTQSKIRAFYGQIFDDSSGGWPLTTSAHLICFTGATNITLTRVTSGDFDSVNFDSTGFNRGYIIIDYVD